MLELPGHHPRQHEQHGGPESPRLPLRGWHAPDDLRLVFGVRPETHDLPRRPRPGIHGDEGWLLSRHARHRDTAPEHPGGTARPPDQHAPTVQVRLRDRLSWRHAPRRVPRGAHGPRLRGVHRWLLAERRNVHLLRRRPWEPHRRRYPGAHCPGTRPHGTFEGGVGPLQGERLPWPCPGHDSRFPGDLLAATLNPGRNVCAVAGALQKDGRGVFRQGCDAEQRQSRPGLRLRSEQHAVLPAQADHVPSGLRAHSCHLAHLASGATHFLRLPEQCLGFHRHDRLCAVRSPHGEHLQLLRTAQR
mmetsp:Transcript_45511/g.102419  ORF Transcript_45511/g.102419 Transcript_45511/m.102419 type:complete len:302 (+) Transcript_45511:189-1094(+)